MAKNFGYTIHHDRQIDYDSLSRAAYQKLLDMEPSVKACISCGTCAATCSAAQYTDFSLRRLVLLLRRGESNEIKTTANKCMLCGKCQIACPMGVNTRNLLLSIQELFANQ
jgi:heterodisulfide reductase subunit C